MTDAQWNVIKYDKTRLKPLSVFTKGCLCRLHHHFRETSSSSEKHLI